MASRDSNAAKLTPSKSPRTRNASAAAAAAARTPPPHPSKTPHAKTPTPKKRSGGAAKADDDNEPPKPVVSRFEPQFELTYYFVLGATSYHFCVFDREQEQQRRRPAAGHHEAAPDAVRRVHHPLPHRRGDLLYSLPRRATLARSAQLKHI